MQQQFRVLSLAMALVVASQPTKLRGQDDGTSTLGGKVQPPQEIDGCPNPGPCGCPGPQPVDLKQYFIPSYGGWQNAKKKIKSKNGAISYYRFRKYASNKYELIKSPDGRCTESFKVGASTIFVTSEFGPCILDSGPREFKPPGLVWMPTEVCPGNEGTLPRHFLSRHWGENLINDTTCTQTGSTNPYIPNRASVIDFAPNWNYGYNVGVVDSIIKTDPLGSDPNDFERYFYGLNRGWLRWEHWENGNLKDWVQQIDEISNNPIPHANCPLP